MPPSARYGPALSPRVRTLVLCAALLSSLALLAVIDIRHVVDAGLPGVPVLVLAAGFTAAALLTFDIEWRHDVQRFTLSDAPMVVALFALAPWQVVVARVLGEAVATVLDRERRPLKILVNFSILVAECVTALLVFHVLFDSASVATPTAWAAALASVVLMDILSLVAITTVIRWHGGQVKLRDMLPTAVGAAVANGCLGVTVTLLLYVHAAAAVLAVTTTAVLFVASRGYSNLRQRYSSLQLLHDFSEAIGGALRADDVVESMLAYARRLLHADVAQLVVFAEAGQSAFRATLRGDDPMVKEPLGDVDALRATTYAGRCVVAPRGSQGGLAAYLSGVGADDGICAPLTVGDGMTGAFIVAQRLTDRRTFDEDDARVFQTLANHATMALEKGRLIEKLRAEAARRQFQAMHDLLTGLPNRTHFLRSAEEAIAAAGPSSRSVAIVLMDLDLFKDINDTLGHHTGDLLLQQIGERVRAASMRKDFVARLGGDEFALVFECDGAADAEDAARTVLRAVQEPVGLSDLLIDVRASMGIAIWPQDGGDVATLLQRADVAMYAAKAAKTGVECYRSEVDHNTPRRLMLASELRQALVDGKLTVHYQPKADLRTDRITAAEALVRWSHPDLGNIPPDEFIPVAEQTGLIAPLTSFVLGEATAQCRSWLAAGLDIGIAVNVSARSLSDPNFVEIVESILERAGLDGSRLTLEITESSIMTDPHRCIDALRELAALGVRLSVDDFGTGYSSLAYLQRLPVDELKVDRSFVFNVGVDESDRAIVRSIVQLGHSLGLQVVAEGVENQLAWDRLVDLGCDLAQGYFLSRPLPAPDLTDWLLRTMARSDSAPRASTSAHLAVVRAAAT